VRTGEVVQKAADPAPPDYAVQTLVNLVLDGNGELFGHRSPLYTYIIRIIVLVERLRYVNP
jgi:hypothetical protein